MNSVNMMRWYKMKVYCPYCREDVDYKIERREVKEFKGIEIDTYENVAICSKCNNDLYINDIEKENNKRIHELYREKVDIIKPEDIVNFRKKYGISQRELTSILGFGKMTINRYEQGKLPTKSQSDYIRLLIENENEFIKKVNQTYEKNEITKKTYEKIIPNSDIKIKKIEKEDIQNLFRQQIEEVLNRKPDIYNGYKQLDLNKVENIISYMAKKVNNLTITSLNKYLWYIDMLSFNQRSVAITGLTYQHEKFGPTIIEQEYNEISLLDDKYKREDYENEIGTMTKIVSNKNYDLSNFSKKEIEIINTIIKLLKDKTVSEISKMSHKEEAWKKTKRYENISFEYAMNLKILKNI